MSHEFCAVFITAADREEAERMATILVDERLAACVNIVPGCRSVYRWKGEISVDDEALMIVKTSAARFGSMRDRVLEIHRYETPEIVSVPLGEMSADYAAFLNDALKF